MRTTCLYTDSPEPSANCSCSYCEHMRSCRDVARSALATLRSQVSKTPPQPPFEITISPTTGDITLEVKIKHVIRRMNALIQSQFDPDPAKVRTVTKIIEAEQSFGCDMINAMLDALEAGKIGWDDPRSPFWNGNFEVEILKRVMMKMCQGAEGNEVDIANYMMMLKYLREKVRDQKTKA